MASSSLERQWRLVFARGEEERRKWKKKRGTWPAGEDGWRADAIQSSAIASSAAAYVNGKDASPLYKFLKFQKGGFLGDGINVILPVERYAPTTLPLKTEVCKFTVP
ncbi:hypothetical protein EJB05_28321, partial [Eragrostis curvula]